jgi:hypothetical protein
MYTVEATAAGAVVGGVVGGVAGGVTGATIGGAVAHCEKKPIYPAVIEGGIQGAKYGSAVGAAIGGCIGLKEGFHYTITLRHDYIQRRSNDTTRTLVRQLLDNFYEGEEATVRMICPITFELLLYPARVKLCAKPHIYELQFLHALVDKGNGTGQCPECRVSFQATHITPTEENREQMSKIIRKAFGYLRSIPENRLVIQKLQQDLGYRIKQIWDYILQHPPEALSTQIQEAIFNRRALSVQGTGN